MRKFEARLIEQWYFRRDFDLPMEPNLSFISMTPQLRVQKKNLDASGC
jgi:hypothetical protein